MPRVGVEAVADQWETHDQPGEHRVPDGRVLLRPRAGQGRTTRSVPTAGPGARRRPVVVRAGRAVPALADAARRRRGGDHGRGPDRGASSPTARAGSRWSSRSTSGPPCRRGRTARCYRRPSGCSTSRTRARSWAAPASSSSPARRARSRVDGDEHRSTAVALRIRRQGIRRLARSGDTRGSRRCSRAAAPSATSSIRRATTACRPTTRATSSTVTGS